MSSLCGEAVFSLDSNQLSHLDELRGPLAGGNDLEPAVSVLEHVSSSIVKTKQDSGWISFCVSELAVTLRELSLCLCASIV